MIIYGQTKFILKKQERLSITDENKINRNLDRIDCIKNFTESQVFTIRDVV
jgi:hypothetical protein